MVVNRAAGNCRLYQLNPAGFETLREYFEQFWGQALSAFRRELKRTSKTAKVKPARRSKKEEQ